MKSTVISWTLAHVISYGLENVREAKVEVEMPSSFMNFGPNYPLRFKID